MRLGGFTFAIILTGLGTLPASAQALGDNLSALQIAIACAPPPVAAKERPDAVRVLGAQASEPKTILGQTDRLVLSGGSARGIAVGQEYFIRRLIVDPAVPGKKDRAWPVHTSGWITIVAVSETTAIATVRNMCSAIGNGD